MLIDTHCHLNFEAFKDDIDEVIKRATEAGVEKIIIPGAKLDSSEKAVEIAGKYDGCYAAVGLHPHHTDEVLKYSSFVQQGGTSADKQRIKVLKGKIIQLAKNKKVVAVGECGLDYYRYEKTVYDKQEMTPETKARQKELFKIHLEAALELNLPVIIHCREAYEELFQIVAENKNKNLRGVIHCFSGTVTDLEKVLEIGFYVGFDGNITYKNSALLTDAVRKTPINRILLETDAPYLSPVPYRGERNEPKNVKISAHKTAELKGLTLEETEKQIYLNSRELFTL